MVVISEERKPGVERRRPLVRLVCRPLAAGMLAVCVLLTVLAVIAAYPAAREAGALWLLFLLAALALGAEGVVMGTRFVATRECPVHDSFKRRLVETEEHGTMLVQRSLRNANRVCKNATAAKTLEMEQAGATLDELLPVISGKNQRRCYETGDVEGCLFPIGQCSGVIHEIKTVQELFDEIVSGSEKVLQRLRNGLG